MSYNDQDVIEKVIAATLDEDLGAAGDITSIALFSETETARAIIRSKADGILSGCGLVGPIFLHCDRSISVTIHGRDGAECKPGTIIAELEGPVRGILAGERLCLNFLQRLSGIATVTRKYCKAIAHTKTRLLDTRKTTPGLRYFEKAAVLHGGGTNHRFGLFDMMLIKDTHVKRSGGVAPALEKAFAWRDAQMGTKIKIEVEVQSVSEFEVALSLHPERIMLDNMSTADMLKCVERRNAEKSSCEIEASGNVTLANIAAVAETGVDFISVGALTHSAPSLDIHLLIT
jgi:nicotinate-nucleotide pyrophosphorylase (carboxylating)